MKIPFVDLQTQAHSLKEDIMPGIESVVDQCNFILGTQVKEFEKNFASFTESRHCFGVASGTDALHLAARALEIGPEDEVIIPAHTFIATALGFHFTGAKIKLVDVEESTFGLDPKKLEITERTKAIVPVHLYGRMLDLSPFEQLKQKHNHLFLVEDAAQAHGAKKNGQAAGSVGDFGCFSFYPGKNLGAFGDAGAVTTQTKGLAKKIDELRQYGSTKKYFHPVAGFNSRLDTMQAVVLDQKLKHLATWNQKRFQAAQLYRDKLKEIEELTLPHIPEAGSHVFHLFVIRCQKRDELLNFLHQKNIGCGIHYPTPIHLHGAFTHLGYKKGDFPVAEKLCDEILSLPMFPEITEQQIDYVVASLKEFFTS